jgi:hypothetical protein
VMDGLCNALAFARIKQEAAERGRRDNADLVLVPEIDRVLVRNPVTGQYEDRCIKCMAHQLLAAGMMERPNYSFQITNPDVVLEWNVKRAWELVEASGRQPQEVDPGWVRRWLKDRSNLTPGHMDHIPAERLSDPILFDHIFTSRDDTAREVRWWPFYILVDGHHRAARALQEGKPIFGHTLTPAEHAEVLQRHNGRFDPELVGWRSREELA